jgi:Predicted glycosyltransferases
MISAVVVFHSDLERLAESVESLRGQAQEIVVIDVSPLSETLGLPAQPDVTYHHRPANLGYGWACNIGIAASANDVVLISNPDVVYSQDALARLAEVATRGHLCGPVQFRGDRKSVV